MVRSQRLLLKELLTEFANRNLYTGSNGYNNVFSFLLADGSTVTNFSADVNLFLKVSVYRADEHDLDAHIVCST